MAPIDDAQDRANEIARQKYSNMFVTISMGGEYINAYDVDADTVEPPKPEPPMATTKETVAAIQKRLNELGAKPTLIVDGIIGRATLTAMLAFLNAKQ